MSLAQLQPKLAHCYAQYVGWFTFHLEDIVYLPKQKNKILLHFAALLSISKKQQGSLSLEAPYFVESVTKSSKSGNREDGKYAGPELGHAHILFS